VEKSKSPTPPTRTLRERAEAQLQSEGEDLLDASSEETQELLHDLHTHQIELEMQNEQLREAQEELMAAHERLSDLYDFAPVGYATISEKGLILEANLTLTEMLGVERRHLIKQPFSVFIVDEDQDTYYLHRRTVLEKKQRRQTCELRMQKKGGEPFWAALECDCAEGASELRCIIVDVTEHKRAEETLRQSEERFRDVAESMADWVWEVDTGGIYTYASSKVKTVLGYTQEEMLGKTPFDLMPPEEATRAGLLFQSIVELKKPIRDLENWNLTKDGRHVCLLTNGVPLLDGHGDLLGYRGIDRDITERKKAEEERQKFEQQMQQTQKLESLGVMAGGIAHDFNNILYAIFGNAELAMDAMPKEAAGREHLDEIRTAAKRASELTDQMLAYSGKGALAIVKMDLSHLIGEMAHLLEVSHTKKAIVKYRFDENLPAVSGDPSQLRQVVMNLITNASEAVGDEGGIITVTTGVADASQEYLAATYVNGELSAGPYVYLEVADTGCGMDEETQRRMFEPFFTTKFTGRGLGMAAVLGIMNAHKGAIKIDSELGRGTTIRVLFPALDEPAKPPAEEVPQEDDWRGRGTVLVVDDERQVRLLQQLVLEQRGFTVLTAEDGNQAVEVFRDNKDDITCVLLDLTMPHMGGEETYAEMHRIRDDVPVLLVSGYSEKELKERVEDFGFAGFLKKPVQSRDLLDKVRAVLKPLATTRGTETILVVDDERLDLELTTNLLTPLGYQVLTANSGQAAVDMVREHEGDIHLVLLDVSMPDMDGPTVLPLLKKERPEMKVLIFSGYDKGFIEQPLLNAGADGFLRKGVASEEMREAIRTVLDG
jgi:two-component system, cell cycle sensor histidine kinase and response regulator CckA